MKLLENAALATYARTRAGFLQVLFGLHRKEEARALATALRALRRVGLGELAWERADRLTAGQQRLLELARLLASGAEVLLLDEPGRGLGPGRSGNSRSFFWPSPARGTASSSWTTTWTSSWGSPTGWW